MITGFNAYIFYIRTKVFFNNKKYNITNKKINKNKFISSWNKTRCDKDGILFKIIEEKMPRNRDKYIRLFSYYYLNNNNFYINEILEDNFKLFKTNEQRLSNILEVVKNDFRVILNLCDKNNKKLKSVFRSKSLPIIFKMFERNKISIYSFIIFDHIFNISKNININNLDFLEKEKFIFVNDKIFNKFKLVVYEFLFNDDYDWIKIFKDI